MPEGSLSVLLSRLDFAWITSMHILYPPLTIGLSIILFLAEWRWMKSGDEQWYRLTRFFEKLFIINFGAGVATGVTMEMAFGILYGPFSQAAGPFFGNILGYETITAFMYEAGFVGLMIFGWGKIGKRMHLFATFNVALSSSLSAMWILVANSWMQTPAGVELENGIFMVRNWAKAIFNPDFLLAFPHMWIAALELSLFFVAGVSAWFVLKNRHAQLFSRALKHTLLALVVVAPLQVYLGDALGRVVAEDQPAALAAMEGHYRTYLPGGRPDTGWHVLAWPNDADGRNDFAVTLPHVLSLLETRTLNGVVPGLDQFKPNERPPVLIPFYAFRLMVASGVLLAFVALWGLYLRMRGRFDAARLRRHPWFLRSVVFSAFLPYLAVWTGWWTREVARQPWVVYGLMRTSAGVSHMSVAVEIAWLVGFVVFEMGVWAGAWYFFAKVIRTGPDLDSPAVDAPQREGDDETPDESGAAHPQHLRPAH